MSNFERDVANTMLDAADARIASLEADKADLLRVLGVADEKIRSGEDARGQYIRENAALEARCRWLGSLLREAHDDLTYHGHQELTECDCKIARELWSSKEEGNEHG